MRMVRDLVIVVALVAFALVINWQQPGTAVADRISVGVLMLLLVVLGATASKSLLTRVLRAMVQQSTGLTNAPPRGSSGPPGPDVPSSPRTGWTGIPSPGQNATDSPPPRDAQMIAAAFLVCLLGLPSAACSAPRPPNNEEQSYAVELGACLSKAKLTDAGAAYYETCRAGVNASHGIDAGRWRE